MATKDDIKKVMDEIIEQTSHVTAELEYHLLEDRESFIVGDKTNYFSVMLYIETYVKENARAAYVVYCNESIYDTDKEKYSCLDEEKIIGGNSRVFLTLSEALERYFELLEGFQEKMRLTAKPDA